MPISTGPRFLWTADWGGGREPGKDYELQLAESRKIPIDYDSKSNKQVNSESAKE